MSAGKAWISTMIEVVMLVTFFYLWQFEGQEGAGNVLTFYLWALAVMSILIGIFGNKSLFKDDFRSSAFVAWKWVKLAIMIGAMTWIGMVWLPAAMLAGSLLLAGARRREPKVTP